MKYIVTITEVIVKTIEVEASHPEAAEAAAREQADPRSFDVVERHVHTEPAP
jgi:hypothetical protein